MRLAVVIGATMIAATVVSPASGQRVVRQNNGELNVEFPGRCTVHYNHSLSIEKVDGSCSGYQRVQADRAIEAYRGRPSRPGYPGYSPYPNSPGAGGQYRIVDTRYDRVQFADGCRIYYNWLGRHLRSQGGCNGTQRDMADRAIAQWRQRSGYYPGGRGYNPGGNWNDIMLLPAYDGGLHVRFTNGCDVYYNSMGYQLHADNKCTGSQRRRADEASRYYAPGTRF